MELLIWIYVGTGAALVFASTRGQHVKREASLRTAWYAFAAAFFCVAGFTSIQTLDIREPTTYRVLAHLRDAAQFLCLGISFVALANALLGVEDPQGPGTERAQTKPTGFWKSLGDLPEENQD